MKQTARIAVWMLACALTAGSLVAAPMPAAAGELGALMGGVAGAVIGNNVGPRSERKTNALWGALGGGFVGHVLEGNRGYYHEPRPVYYAPPPPPRRVYVYEERYVPPRRVIKRYERETIYYSPSDCDRGYYRESYRPVRYRSYHDDD